MYSFRDESMIAIETKTVALFGNPNSGKSSLFNQLTGLRQKVGNFPGVTVDRKVARLQLFDEQEVKLIDFPGTYSIYPNSQDERIVATHLCNPSSEDYPDAVIYVADITHLEKHLLLFTQLRDLGLPILLMLSMNDLAEQEGLVVDVQKLSKVLEVPVLQFDGRAKSQHTELKTTIQNLLNQEPAPTSPLYKPSSEEKTIIQAVRTATEIKSDYHALLLAHHHDWLPNLETSTKNSIQEITEKNDFKSLKHQIQETLNRFDHFSPIVNKVISKKGEDNTITDRLDQILTHRFWGVLIFFALMLLVFQAIFAWASYPMDGIEATFGWLGEQVETMLPDNWFRSLLVDGILAGLAGVLVFIPQIAILFFLIALLEEVGYMARAVFLFDRVMQRFGMNGRSLVALISGGACAIPAIMSTRTISDWKERLITILVTPFISCSARIPVYIVLVAFVVPAGKWLFISWQAWAFMGLYLLGITTALVSAWVLKKVLKAESHSFLMLELPKYRSPRILDVLLTVWDKVKSFILEAGKIILLISIVLWFLASYGPGEEMQLAEQEAIELATQQNLDEQATDNLIAAKKIESSYAGILGKTIEPVIRPLGFDWKIGIALITSFAAREVFVGTMATIYSIGSEEDEYKIQERMAKERHILTGQPVYTLATSLSLLIFYVLAMQCVSTLAVVKKETNSWRWPTIQFVAMTAMAYLGSLLVYQFLG
ncbi:MAG: ferrous iron transport protein B [Bacteroidota bacterium]